MIQNQETSAWRDLFVQKGSLISRKTYDVVSKAKWINHKELKDFTLSNRKWRNSNLKTDNIKNVISFIFK